MQNITELILSICLFACLVSTTSVDDSNYYRINQPIAQDDVVQPVSGAMQGHPEGTHPWDTVGPKVSQELPGEDGYNPSEIDQLKAKMHEMKGKPFLCVWH